MFVCYLLLSSMDGVAERGCSSRTCAVCYNPPAHAWLHSVGPVRRLRASHSITQVIYLATLSHKLVKHVTTLCLVNYLPDFEIFPVYAAVKEGYLNLCVNLLVKR